MSTEIQIYHASCSGEHLQEPQEMGFSADYVATTLSDAVRQAARFLVKRCQAFDLRPGCIKVSIMTVRPISEDGSLQTTKHEFFEWKHDTSPWTVEHLTTITIGG